MVPTQPPAFLPALLGALFQRGSHGELALEQNDGGRRLFWSYGKLVFLKSDVAGEQFGNYLLRQGVLDLAALKELLADPGDERLGEKVVNWGLLSSEQRNQHLADLYDLILLNALEHQVVRYEWKDGASAADLAGGVPISLDHRKLVWQALTRLNSADTIPSWISSQRGWKWQAPEGLLSTLADLPIDPQQAYALSFLGVEPLEFDTLLGASGLEPASAARLVLALWAIGGMTLAEGEPPSLLPRKPEPPPAKAPAQATEQSQVSTGKVPALSPAAAAAKPEPGAPPKPLPLIMPPTPPPPRSVSRPAPGPAAATDEMVEIEIVEDEEPEAGSRSTPPRGTKSGPIKLEMAELSSLSEPAPQPSSKHLAFDAHLPDPGTGTGSFSAEEPEETDLLGRARKLFRVAKNLQAQERSGDAIQALEQCVRLDPDSPDAYAAWLLLGRLRMTNPAWSTRAVEALQSASRLNPKAAEPWAVMGEIYHRKGFRANAKGCFKKAMELDPSVPIPPDFSMEDKEADGNEKPAGGMLEKLKGFMKR